MRRRRANASPTSTGTAARSTPIEPWLSPLVEHDMLSQSDRDHFEPRATSVAVHELDRRADA